MERVVIPSGNWTMALADAIENAGPDTVIVVNTDAKKELGLSAAERMGKEVTIEVEELPSPF